MHITKRDWVGLVVLAVLVLGVALVGIYVFFGSYGPPRAVFVNHSGQALVIVIYEQSFQLPPNSVTQTRFVDETGTIRIGILKNGAWSYKSYKWAPVYGSEYRQGDRIFFQVEADGNIYVLPFAVKSPVKDLPWQPVGFPLKPRQD